MTLPPAFTRASERAAAWLGSLESVQVTPSSAHDAIEETLGALPDGPTDDAEVIDLLADAVEPGLAGMGAGRWFGFVIGGAHPVSIAADWLVSAWDQNAGMLPTTPGVVAAERVAARWIVDLLGLPSESSVGFVTGGTTANLVGILVGRDELLRRSGWDPDKGLAGGPSIRVLAGAEVHISPLQALRYAGLPQPELLDVDAQGRMLPAGLEAALSAEPDRPALVLLQAGDIHSGDSDPFAELVPIARRHPTWVHVDGAFGLWQAASPALSHLTTGLELADSWATDAHKTLNVPYDCGMVIVRDATAHRRAMSMHAPYLFAEEEAHPYELVPEMSRRARGVPVWATLRALGRSGVVDLVDRLHLRALQLADGIGSLPGARVLNDVVFTQVCVAFEDDARTRAIVEEILAEGEVWMSGSEWHGRAVLRISVSNWATSEDDVARSVAAVARAVRLVGRS